jgi:alanine racemase
MAVVKANGYGLGITEVAEVVSDAGADYCGVARVDEALELRKAGIDSTIQILGYTHNDRFHEAISNEITLTIFHPEQVDIVQAAAAEVGRNAKVHVKVDTGMSRLGARPETAYEIVKKFSEKPEIILEGIFTHFACADELSNPITGEQEKLFLDLVSEIQASGIQIPMIHAANSAAALTRPSSYLDMVRVGIALYGMKPSDEVPLPDNFTSTLSWKAQISSVLHLPPGRGISYGHAYVTQGHETIGVVPVGYGDGYRRVFGNEVLVQGKRAPVVGKVCMDQIMIQLDNIPDAGIGDEVVLLGKQGDEIIRPSELAQKWGTINYEMTCDLSARVPRFYHG